jgi:tetratricopeptide (TPR) repeat protein
LDPDLAIREAQRVVDFLSARDPDLEAATLVCLSYLFVRTSRFKQGVEAAQRAYDIFKDRGNREGMIVSLTNMSACLGGLDDRVQQRRCATIVIDAADELHRPRLRAAGLNHLAICQRKDGQPKEAQVSLEECIAISQELRDAECEAMNINNLGNVYFDVGDLDEAEVCHREALCKARTHGIIREEARSLELLARIESRKKNHFQALRLADKAIELYNRIGDGFRIASTHARSGWDYAESDHYVEAAQRYQRAAEIYREFESLHDAAENFERAGTSWAQALDNAKALACFHMGIQCARAGADPQALTSLLEAAGSLDSSADYGHQYLDLLRMNILTSHDRSFAGFMPTFAAYFKRWASAGESRQLFAQGLDALLCSLTDDANPNTLNAIAVALEQSDERLIDDSVLTDLVTRLAHTVDGLYRRQLADGHEVYTIGLRWKTNCIAQVYSWETDLTTRRLAVVLALVLAANRQFLESQAVSAGGVKEPGFVLNLLTQSDFEASITPIPDTRKLTPELPFTITESAVPWDEPQPQSIGIIHDEYAEATDWASLPNNKSVVWLLMVLYGAFVGHVAHRQRGELARQAREFAELVLG